MTASDRLVRLLSLVDSEPDLPTEGSSVLPRLQRVCRAACQNLSASGVGVSLMSRSGWRGVVAATSPFSGLLEELQFRWGEGPCIDAFESGHAVLVDDLDDRVWASWSGYAPAAYAEGVRAVFAFPLQIGAARLGVMDVYRDTAGELGVGELSDAVTFAEILVNALVDDQENAPRADQTGGLEEAFDYRIYQAQGMVAIQLNVGLAEAMSRLRAYAVANNRTLSDLAVAVLAGSVRLEEEGP